MKTLVNFIIWLILVSCSGTVLTFGIFAIMMDINHDATSLAEAKWWSWLLALAFILFYLRITFKLVKWTTNKLFNWD